MTNFQQRPPKTGGLFNLEGTVTAEAAINGFGQLGLQVFQKLTNVPMSIGRAALHKISGVHPQILCSRLLLGQTTS